MTETIEEQTEQPHAIMFIVWLEQDQCYLVGLPEWAGHLMNYNATTHGDTYEEAAKNGAEVLRMLAKDPEAIAWRKAQAAMLAKPVNEDEDLDEELEEGADKATSESPVHRRITEHFRRIEYVAASAATRAQNAGLSRNEALEFADMIRGMADTLMDMVEEQGEAEHASKETKEDQDADDGWEELCANATFKAHLRELGTQAKQEHQEGKTVPGGFDGRGEATPDLRLALKAMRDAVRMGVTEQGQKIIAAGVYQAIAQGIFRDLKATDPGEDNWCEDDEEEEADEKPRYSMFIQWSDKNQAYLVSLPEWTRSSDGSLQYIARGSNYEEAAKNGYEVLEKLIEQTKRDNKTLPEAQTAWIDEEDEPSEAEQKRRALEVQAVDFFKEEQREDEEASDPSALPLAINERAVADATAALRGVGKAVADGTFDVEAERPDA